MDNDDKELQTFVGQNYFKGEQAEHLHLQKEVIQPMRKSLDDERQVSQGWFEKCKKREEELTKLEAKNKALMEAAKTLRSWLDPDVAESENKTFLNDVAKLDQLLTKNEG
jgi:hypothetical protein